MAETPDAVAVAVTLPAVIPTASPLTDTVATAGLELDQVNLAPGRILPLELKAVAVNCAALPTASVTDFTVTDATFAFPDRDSKICGDIGDNGVVGSPLQAITTNAEIAPQTFLVIIREGR